MLKGMRQSIGKRHLAPVVVLVALLLAGVGWWYYTARPTPLAAAEVRPLLAEHSLLGAWGSASRKYALYLGGDGIAAYQEQGLPVTHGQWRIEGDGAVCLAFEGIATNCYHVGRDGELLVWILPGSGRTYPFATRPGRVEGL